MAKKVVKTAPRKPARRKRQTYRKAAKGNFVRVTGRTWRDGKVSAQFPTWVVVAAIVFAVIMLAPAEFRAGVGAGIMQLFDWLARDPKSLPKP
jgi:hypothetical protein